MKSSIFEILPMKRDNSEPISFGTNCTLEPQQTPCVPHGKELSEVNSRILLITNMGPTGTSFNEVPCLSVLKLGNDIIDKHIYNI